MDWTSHDERLAIEVLVTVGLGRRGGDIVDGVVGRVIVAVVVDAVVHDAVDELVGAVVVD